MWFWMHYLEDLFSIDARVGITVNSLTGKYKN